MKSIDAFPFGSATALAAALRDREVSAVELLREYLARVDKFNPRLNALIVDDRERALRDAQAADAALARGEVLGPLHGVPMTVKESFDLQGHPTTQGYVPAKDNMATQDAVAVQRLKAAGAVVFGKTNVPLFLGDFQSYNEIYGTTNNPWDLTRGPGGSSGGGAAALAAGLTSLEFGSDIGGSIRNPAAYCGVYGHKPTWTVVPKRGHHLPRVPIAEVDLSVIGPLARSARDLQVALDVTAGPDELTRAGVRYDFPPPPQSLKGLRVGVWLDEPLAPVARSVDTAIRSVVAMLRAEGAVVDEAARPEFDARAAHEVYNTLLFANMGARRADFEQLCAQAAALSPSDDSDKANSARAMVPMFKTVYDAANRREQLRWAWHAFFQKYDVMITPVTATPAFRHDHNEPPAARTMNVDGRDVPYFSQLFWAGLATCSFLPATAVPVGVSEEGLPIGAQLIGAEMRDRTTLWLAARIEEMRGGFVPPAAFR
ncbi:amidase [Ramlibacter albus]|uniref:Amidase n=1 Tax=Ramlibacter albus TaxID=2079448 RepID=A0A923S2A7_9BURK|nr:amidase [Ramlibacter albus]MBC5764558.1 amidase [Ramlibacter albus]